MQVIYASDFHKLPHCVATVGIFDGVHAGHRYLIGQLRDIALSKKLSSAVITFAEHPRKVLNSDFQPALLSTLDEKINQLATTGIDYCVVFSFTKEIALLSAKEFIENILHAQLHVQCLLVGHDHRFGHNRAEGLAEYQLYGSELGIEVIGAQRYTTISDEFINSTRIRSALQSGDVEQAHRLLTYHYSVKGEVVRGEQLGRSIGFPTANVQLFDQDKLLPANAVYAVMVLLNGNLYQGMLNIGFRPTVSKGLVRTIEVNIFDFDADVYGCTIELIFMAFVRSEQKFEGVHALMAQLQRDKQQVKHMLSGIK